MLITACLRYYSLIESEQANELVRWLRSKHNGYEHIYHDRSWSDEPLDIIINHPPSPTRASDYPALPAPRHPQREDLLVITLLINTIYQSERITPSHHQTRVLVQLRSRAIMGCASSKQADYDDQYATAYSKNHQYANARPYNGPSHHAPQRKRRGRQ